MTRDALRELEVWVQRGRCTLSGNKLMSSPGGECAHHILSNVLHVPESSLPLPIKGWKQCSRASSMSSSLSPSAGTAASGPTLAILGRYFQQILPPRDRIWSHVAKVVGIVLDITKLLRMCLEWMTCQNVSAKENGRCLVCRWFMTDASKCFSSR